jgi:glycosyltransferase involved in cell wall biosynthesis
MPTFHLLTGEYPPQAGGVGHYTACLAEALARRGCDVSVWCPESAVRDPGSGVRDPEMRGVHPLPDAFGSKTQAALERALADAPGCLLLQYAPNALGRRGMNLPFCLWLLRMRRSGADVRVMFHEPYFYFTLAHPLRNVLALAQRAMAAVLLRAATTAYLSTDTWIRYLRPYAPARIRFVTLPIPSTIATAAADDAVQAWRARTAGSAPLVGHFGTYGRDVVDLLDPAALAILDADARVHVLFAGHRSEQFARTLTDRHPRFRDRVHATGTLGDADAAAALQACDLLLQPYPDGVTTRRTSVMPGLALGVATLTTTGTLTEPLWHESGAAALVPAGDAGRLRDAALALLADERARRAQGGRGAECYGERFSIERSADVVAGRLPDAAARASRVS